MSHPKITTSYVAQIIKNGTWRDCPVNFRDDGDQVNPDALRYVDALEKHAHTAQLVLRRATTTIEDIIIPHQPTPTQQPHQHAPNR